MDEVWCLDCGRDEKDCICDEDCTYCSSPADWECATCDIPLCEECECENHDNPWGVL